MFGEVLARMCQMKSTLSKISYIILHSFLDPLSWRKQAQKMGWPCRVGALHGVPYKNDFTWECPVSQITPLPREYKSLLLVPRRLRTSISSHSGFTGAVHIRSVPMRPDARRFLAFVQKPLRLVTLGDLVNFAETLTKLAPASLYRVLASIKSLFAFGHRIGYLEFDAGRVLRLPAARNQLAQRILPEADVHRMLSLEPDDRNRALLTLLYASGIRVTRIERNSLARL